jgi:dihydrodipicolinate reductase
MGQESVMAIENDPDLILLGQTDLENDLEFMINKTGAEVVVDFTTASVAYTNSNIIIQAGIS